MPGNPQSKWARNALATLAFTSLFAGTQAKILAGLPVIDSPDKTLHVPFKSKRDSQNPNRRSLDNTFVKRDDKYLEISLDNYLTYYNIEVGLGTPAQSFNLLIDTGSSDMWVIDESNPYCTTDASEISSGDGINCTKSGVFDTNSSSTFITNSSDFYISYGDNTVAEGDWARDTLDLSGNKIYNMSFGLGTTTNSSIGILGIGYAANEATQSLTNGYTYENLPLRLVSEGIINTPAYSLWLNDINSEDGNVLFGGVDHDKYTGDLVSLDVQIGSSKASQPYSLLVEFTALEYSDSSGDQSLLNSTINALLDSGTSLTYFPTSLADSVLSAFDSSYSSSLGYYVTSCSSSGSLNYTFGDSVTIQVPFSSLLLPITDRRGKSAQLSNGKAACAIGILPSSYKFALLGDTFLRSAYVVFDLKNDKIAMAQAAANVTSSNIEVISDAIPSTPAGHSSSSSNSGSSSSSSSSSSHTSKSASNKLAPPISLGAPTASALVAVFCIFSISTLASLM